jgi:hypothetical protein
MAVNILLKRSSTANKRPTSVQAPVGSVVLNYDSATGGLYYQDSATGIIKVGPAQVSATAPNATPAGSSGNSIGEFWYDTANSALKIWTGAAWVTSGGSGSVTSVTGTSPIIVNNATPATPVISINPASTTTAGAVQLNDTIVSTSTTLAATANSVKLVADLANTMLPKAGGTMTGAIVFAAGQTFPGTAVPDASSSVKGIVQIGTNIQVAAGVISVLASSTSQAGVVQLNDTTGSTSVAEAATANAVKTTFDIANVALPKAGGTMTGAIVFAAGQTFPISGIQDATGAQKGVVQIGANITVASGTISIADATLTVPGVVTVGTNIGVTAGVISVLSSSTSQSGVVQLNDTVASDSVLQALTANQGKQLQTQINSLTAASTLTLAGTITAATGNMVTVTADGTLKSFVVGDPLPSAAVGNTDYFAIVVTPGTFTPPGGSSTTFNAGDWVLSNGTIWERLSVGFAGSAATTTTSGLVELATNAETQTGTDANSAVTPASLQSKLSDSTSTTSSNTIASSTAVKSAFDLATAAVPKSTVTTAGDLIYGTAAATVARLGIGTAGQVLTVNTGATAPVWTTPAGLATPTVAGLVFGKNDAQDNAAFGKNAMVCMGASGPIVSQNVAVGCDAMCGSTTGLNNVAIGYSTMADASGGLYNVAVGAAALLSNNNGCQNVALGNSAASLLTASSCNIAIGSGALGGAGVMGNNVSIGTRSLRQVVGSSNVAIGQSAGCAMTTGNCNVIIGNLAQPLVTTGSCQLAIGFSATDNWLTGTSSKAIKPGAGIIDCTDSCGTGGQALLSNGANALCWGSVIPTSAITSFNATSNCGFYGGNLLISQWEDGNILTPTALNPGPEGSMLCFNSTINGLAWCTPNFLRGNQFAKGSIAVGCAQVGGGIGTAAFNGTGNNPGVAVGYYESIPLTGGTGSGATANFTVFNTGFVVVIEFVSISDPGSGYLVGDDLTVVINSVTIPFTLNVNTLATNTINNYSFLSVGTDGQVLAADSTCANGVKWASTSTSPATPTTTGTVIGCTVAANTALGCSAFAANLTGVCNVAIGTRALCATTNTVYTTAVGALALCAVTTGGTNVALGALAGKNITTGGLNVVIGTNLDAPSATGSCQLAIGYDAACYWLTGCSDLSIKPGAGIRDCAGSAGTAGQVLTSNGSNAVCWSSPTGLATPTVAGTTLSRISGGNGSVGFSALKSVTTGFYNAALAENAGCNITTGTCNVALGGNAGCSVTTGSSNIALGGGSGQFIDVGSCNVTIGANVQVPFGNQNSQLAIGWGTCRWITGDSNTNLCVYNGFVIKGCSGGAGAAGLAVNDSFFYADGNNGAVLSLGNCFGNGKAYLMFRNPSNAVIGCIVQNSNTGVVFFTGSSDYRLKENLKNIEGATEVLRALPVYEYNFISEPEVVHQGFLAHELQEVVPLAVSGTKDEVDEEGNPKYQGVDFTKLVPLLTAALKESIARADSLENSLKESIARIDALETKVKGLESNA